MATEPRASLTQTREDPGLAFYKEGQLRADIRKPCMEPTLETGLSSPDMKSHSPGALILGCASQGSGSGDEARLRELLEGFRTQFITFEKAHKRQSFLRCLRALRQGGFDLFCLEGTGFAAGLAAILGRLLWRRRFVVSSGDAVAPFLRSKMPIGAPFFSLYERLLYSCSTGFIGWTPYLVGRALSMGATRGITAPGWAADPLQAGELEEMRHTVRRALDIPQDAVVFGLAGSLIWSTRHQFCYGAELVRAALRCTTPPYVLIVGAGSGLEELKRLAGPQLGKRILLPGRVPKEDVLRYLAAMDVGSLPQSVDGVGSFRYTTKLPEYRLANLLVVTNQIPMAYDLDRGDFLRLRGDAPWDDIFLQDLTDLMQTCTAQQIETRKRHLSPALGFDKEAQIERVTVFLSDLMAQQRPTEKAS